MSLRLFQIIRNFFYVILQDHFYKSEIDSGTASIIPMLLPARYDASIPGGKAATSTHIRAVLKAILEDGTILIQPLCSHHDIALALKQLLLESNRFQQAYLQIPHIIRGPFLRDPKTIFRYTYMIDQPEMWQILKPDMRVLRYLKEPALMGYLCPVMCPQVGQYGYPSD